MDYSLYLVIEFLQEPLNENEINSFKETKNKSKDLYIN